MRSRVAFLDIFVKEIWCAIQLETKTAKLKINLINSILQPRPLVYVKNPGWRHSSVKRRALKQTGSAGTVFTSENHSWTAFLNS